MKGIDHFLKEEVREDLAELGILPPPKRLLRVVKMIRENDPVPDTDGGVAFPGEVSEEEVDEARPIIHPDWALEYKVFKETGEVLSYPVKKNKEFIFDCPHCGDPAADVEALTVDVHSGATYKCSVCGELVQFEVNKA